MNAQGFPSRDKRNSGSKVNLRPMVKLMIAAGFPKLNMGMTEIPLLVMVVDVANCKGLAVESTKSSEKQWKPMRQSMKRVKLFNWGINKWFILAGLRGNKVY